MKNKIYFLILFYALSLVYPSKAYSSGSTGLTLGSIIQSIFLIADLGEMCVSIERGLTSGKENVEYYRKSLKELHEIYISKRTITDVERAQFEKALIVVNRKMKNYLKKVENHYCPYGDYELIQFELADDVITCINRILDGKPPTPDKDKGFFQRIKEGYDPSKLVCN